MPGSRYMAIPRARQRSADGSCLPLRPRRRGHASARWPRRWKVPGQAAAPIYCGHRCSWACCSARCRSSLRHRNALRTPRPQGRSRKAQRVVQITRTAARLGMMVHRIAIPRMAVREAAVRKAAVLHQVTLRQVTLRQAGLRRLALRPTAAGWLALCMGAVRWVVIHLDMERRHIGPRIRPPGGPRFRRPAMLRRLAARAQLPARHLATVPGQRPLPATSHPRARRVRPRARARSAGRSLPGKTLLRCDAAAWHSLYPGAPWPG